MAFCFVWLLGTFRIKPDVTSHDRLLSRLRPAVPRTAYAAALIFGLMAFLRHRPLIHRVPVLFHPGVALAWTSAVLTVGGIGFAIWARVHLADNWSARPSRKQAHALVTSGPYRIVRHPIYTGMMTAIVGLALTGLVSGPFVLLLVMVIFLRRVVREEQIMMELFPDQYPAYRERTKRLIPLVW
jgi:protein-S-isoprenylcysteine O-methyltransferase Ste14